MKNFTILLVFLIAFVYKGNSQGLENFDNSNATNSYADNNFVGQDGITWYYIASRNANGDANNSGINLPALMLRRSSSSSKVYSETIIGGIGSFSVKLYKGFTGGGNRQVELFINDVSYGTSTAFDDFDEHTFSVNDINVPGDIVIRIDNITAKQVIVDDITWTGYGGSASVATPIISPSSGDYFAPIDVSITCSTDGATIFYSTDGSDPDPNSTLYSGSFSVSSTTTVKARAYKAGLTESGIATNEYNFPTPISISNIAQLRTQAIGDDYYQLTGEAILTFQQSFRSQKYIQDATAAILIDDDNDIITTVYDIYDGITGIIGTLSEYGGMLQFIPIVDPGAATSTGNTITPEIITIDQITSNFDDYESELVKIKNVVFSDAGADFSNGTAYEISDGSKALYNFRTTFYGVDYIGTEIPSAAQDLVLIPNSRNDGDYVTSRSSADIVPSTGGGTATHLDIIQINNGNAVYDGQPFSVTVQTQDASGAAANTSVNVDVTLSIGTGAGTIGGTITGTIVTGNNTTTISGVTYSPSETGVVLNVNDDASSLVAGNSDAFNVLEVVIADLVITEIMYNSPESNADSLEYIEIFNNSSSSIDLTGYSFSGITHVFPNVSIESDEYLLIAKDSVAIFNSFGVSSYQWESGSLSNSGELIVLSSEIGITVDSVDYKDVAPWPVAADGNGPSITICDPTVDNALGENWHASVHFLTVNADNDSVFGSPGTAAYPVADFIVDNQNTEVGAEVEFSEMSSCNAISFSWEFEGGTPATSDEANPSISYLSEGIYNVTLTVTNDIGSSTLVKTDYITVSASTAGDLVITEIMYNPPESGDDSLEYVEIYNNSSVAVNLLGYSFVDGITYTFTDVSMASNDYLVIAKDSVALFGTLGVEAYQWTGGSLSNGGELLVLASPIGVVVDSVDYDDNDPWPTEADGDGPSITICDPEIDNALGENWHASVHFLAVNADNDSIFGSPGMAPAPVANFVADNQTIEMGAQVQFTDMSTCNATTYSWVFEGGTPATSDETNPLITYSVAGMYDVTLTVTNSTGSNTLTVSDYIEVSDSSLPPVADFEADVTTIFAGQSVDFTDLSTNSPTIFNWIFEEGTPTSSSDQNPTVVYNTPGIFDVTLYVENSVGDDTEIKTDYITVLPSTAGDLVITEIMYNPPESGDDSLEYIEIYNNSDDIVNLFGYAFTDGITYTFTDISMASNDYLVVAKDSVAMFNTFGVDAYQWTDGGLSNGGELLKLSSPIGITIDSVEYSDGAPWPVEADGDGPSITICDPSTDNSIGENWHASVNFLTVNADNDSIFGSPGMAPAPVANFEADNQFITPGSQVQFTDMSTCNATTYSWVFEGGTPETSSDSDPLITYDMAGDFYVSLTVSNSTGGNTITFADYIHVSVGTIENSIESIMVNPNPSTGFFNIANPNNVEMSIAVYNILGELVIENQRINGDQQIDLGREQNGIYILHIVMNGERKSLRIIKQ